MKKKKNSKSKAASNVLDHIRMRSVCQRAPKKQRFTSTYIDALAVFVYLGTEKDQKISFPTDQ